MTQFILIQVGDTVYDKVNSVSGKVLEIDKKTNIASIKTDSPYDEIILTQLSSLTVLNKSKKKNDSEGGNKWFNQVKVFHKGFDHPVADKPTQMTLERSISRSIWCGEEILEFLHASSANEDEFNSAYDKMIEGLHKAKQKSLAMDYYADGIDTIVAQADALIDAAYFINGSFVEMLVEPDRLFDIVQKANMSKLFSDEDGNKYAKYRESDGKILKSPEFFEPEPLLKQEIKRQLNK